MLFKTRCILIAISWFVIQVQTDNASSNYDVDEYIKNQNKSSVESYISTKISVQDERSFWNPQRKIHVPVEQSGRHKAPKKRGKMKHKKGDNLLQRILPMMIIPFMVQTGIIPIMLSMLKMMLIKSAVIGSIGIIIGLINMFTKSSQQGGVYAHDVSLHHGHHMPEELVHEHYGYNGGTEYGAYFDERSNK